MSFHVVLLIDGNGENELSFVDFDQLGISNSLDVADIVLNMPAVLLNDTLPGVDKP